MPMPFAHLGRHILRAFGRPAAITRTRYPAGSYDPNTGDWARGAGTDEPIEAVVQPATPDDIEQVPEGERGRETIVLFTLEPLRPASSTAAVESDVVAWSGARWKVVATDDWAAQAHYGRSVATRIGT